MPDRKCILIVEDDKPLREFFRLTLRMAGFDVQEAANGLDAIRVLDWNPPDLVLLDLNLPDVDGLHVHEEIRQSFVTRHIPVVIVTGSPRDVSNVDAECVLHKPVTPERLVEVVRKCLPR